MNGIKNAKGVLYIVGTEIQMKKMITTLATMYPKEKFHLSTLIPKNPQPLLGKYKRNVIDETYHQLQLPMEEKDEEHSDEDQKE